MTKIKINIGANELSQKEIDEGKNFQALLEKFELVKTPFYKRPRFLISSGIIVILLTSIVVTTKLTKTTSDNSIIKAPVQKEDVQETLESPQTSNTIKSTGSENIISENKNNKAPEMKTEIAATVLAQPNEAERMKEMNKLEQSIDSLKNKFQKLNHNMPIEPKMARKNGYTFNIDVLPEEFPEIAIYKDVVFELEESKKDQFKELTSIDWERGELKDNIKGLNYIMELQKGKDIRKFIVYPVYQGKSYENAVYEHHKYLHELDEVSAQIEAKENQIKELSKR